MWNALPANGAKHTTQAKLKISAATLRCRCSDIQPPLYLFRAGGIIRMMRAESLQTVLGVLLVASTLALFSRACANGFVNYDDTSYVTRNGHVQGGLTPQNVAWAFRSLHAANWHPLTWLSLEIDAQLYSLRAWGFHLTSIVLHAASALILFRVLVRMTNFLRRSALVAALFAVHPLHVESVAWISERKDTLSVFLGLLTLMAYVNYVERPDVRRYLLMASLYTLGLMAKPMLVTLPCVLLLLDYWPLNRYGESTPGGDVESTATSKRARHQSVHWLVVEKLPLFALAIVGSAVTLVAQQQGEAVNSIERLPMSNRVANALVAYVSYIEKMIWPEHLAAVYPLPDLAAPVWRVSVAALVLACVTTLAILQRRQRPYLLVGWFWYLGTLVPVIGLVQVGQQAMADRYTYFPMVGLLLILVWGLAELFDRLGIGVFVRGALAAGLLATLMAATWSQVAHWHDSVVLWRHAILVTSDNYIAYTNLGMALDQLGQKEEAERAQDGSRSQGQSARHERLSEAIEQYSKALAIKDDLAPAYFNRGVALAQLGRTQEAIHDFSEAIRHGPSLAKAYYNRGLAYKMLDQLDRAVQDFTAALNLQESDRSARTELALTLMHRGEYADAAKEFTVLVETQPNDAAGHSRLGTSLCLLGKHLQAIDSFRQALALEPMNVRHYFDLAHAFEAMGRGDLAGPYYRKGLEIDPHYPFEAARRAWLLATDPTPTRRNGAMAVRLASQACEATGARRAELLDILAAAHAEAGRFEEAVSEGRRAAAIASSAGDTALAERVSSRLKLYERKEPYRERPERNSTDQLESTRSP
jgi:tetratricopeptide (TPR) repeat protein